MHARDLREGGTRFHPSFCDRKGGTDDGMYSWNKSVILGYLLRLEIKILDAFMYRERFNGNNKEREE